MMTPTERILSVLAERNCDPRRNGNGWSARCPAHDDRRPSLSVSEGDDGRALVKCFAGCTIDAICNAVGLQAADLFSDASNRTSESARSSQPLKRRQDHKQAGGRSKSFETANAAVDALERKYGKRSHLWVYRDANGNPVGVVVRWDNGGTKVIRPVARRGEQWTIGGMPEPRPLYCLPDLADVDRVYITEGEKAADAARAIGLTATTSAHGSQSPEKTDWSHLAGKECVILPDRDGPGMQYAEKVASILAKLKPPPVVKVVELPELPDHGDIADWVGARPETDAGELRRQVEALVDEVAAIRPDRPVRRIEQYQPFPTDALPEPIRGFVIAGATAIGCDTSYVALPLLTALGAAIGNTRRIQLKRGWLGPPIIWTAIVGESGTSKSPAFKLVMRAIEARQTKSLDAHAEAMKRYDDEISQHNKAMSEWMRDKKTVEPPPAKPDPPVAARFVVKDITVEALAPLLLENPRGVLVARDELAGWLASFDLYTGGKGGADAAHWLSMHNGESIVVDRKTGNPRTIFVPQASVSVTGGIQPVVLHRALGSQHRESGLAARILLACPPRKPKQWTEADIAPQKEVELAKLFDRLYDLEMGVSDEGEVRPVVLGLTPNAKAAFKEYYNRHAEEHADLSGELSAAWSKLEEYAARLALVIQCTRWAAGDAVLESPDVVDAASMKSGIRLAEWFKAEARRVYSLLSESDDDRQQRRLIEWIDRKGGSVTVREVQQGHRRFGTARDAEAALTELEKAGYGHWHAVPPGPYGGRPSRVFRLSSTSTSTKPSGTRDSKGSVDVDGLGTPESSPDDDWGEL